jgi:exonuclease III
MCLQETRLKHKQKPTIKNYKGYFHNKIADVAQHGTALFVKDNITSEEIAINTDLDAVAARVHLDKPVSVVSLYIPPGDIDTDTKVTEAITQNRTLITQLEKPYIPYCRRLQRALGCLGK